MQQGYRTIVIDPPWNMKGGGRIRRGADRHYPLLKPREIVPTIKHSGVFTPDPRGCHCYLWITNNFLPLGLEVLADLGFRYVTNMAWVKDRFGIGLYFRGQHELCLFGVAGAFLPPPHRNVPSLITAKRRRHSQKPDEFFAAVERVSPAPRLEMFACGPRPGWDTWGPESHRDSVTPQTLDSESANVTQ